MTKPITAKQFHQSDGTEQWRVLGEGACTFFRSGSFDTSLRLAQAIGGLDGVADLEPDLDVRRDGVTVRLIEDTDDYYGLVESHIELARQVTATAGRLGLVGEHPDLQTVQLTIDALDIPALLPFWRAVLDYRDREPALGNVEDLVDPRGRGIAIWFQQMDEPREQRNRIHFDVWVTPEQFDARVAAALAAGGRLVSDAYAPSWTVLADAEGNEACVCSATGRDD